MGEEEGGEIRLHEYKYRTHGGQVVGEILKDHGVKYVFGIPGTYVWGLETGFHDHGIRSIHTRQQQGAAYAADAYARCTRSPGVCFGNGSIGVMDSLSGINQAWLARAPVIGLFGMHEWEQSHRGAFQEAYPSSICNSMTKWSVDIDDTRSVPSYLRRALRDCMAYPPGPIVMGLTMKALGRLDRNRLIGNVPQEATARPSPTQGDPAAVERAFDLLLNAERPVIVAGEGVYWADAGAELRELAELLGIPVNMRRGARGAMPEDHPLAIGGGYRGDFWADADVILIIGLKLGSLERQGRAPAWPSEAKRIVVDESAIDAWAPLPTEEFITGNPKQVLRQMVDHARYAVKQAANGSAWLEHLDICRQEFEDGLRQDEADYANSVPIHPWVLAREVAGFLDADATIVFDSFLGSTFLTDKIKAKFDGQILDSGDAGSIGHGIGMGIGAQLARPGKEVFVLTSDASIGMQGGDLETALRYNLPIVYLVCNTGNFHGGVSAWFQEQVDSWEMLPDLRYDKMYEAIGCHSEYVTKPDEIRPALYRAFNSGKVAVVNAAVDGRVIHPWFESVSIRRGVVAHQLDVNSIPEPFRSHLWQGRTPEVERELERFGVPRSKTRKRALAYDLTPCWEPENQPAKSGSDI